MKHQLTFGSREVSFTLAFQKRKSLGIKVHPDGLVEVVAPLAAKEDQVLEKIKGKLAWIVRQLDHFEAYKPSTPVRRFVNGETHLYLGRQYRLRIVSDETDHIKAYRGQLWMYARKVKPYALKVQLDQWYKQRASTIFSELLEEVLPRFKRYRIVAPILTIRTMSKRWGSCTRAGRITLNTELIKAPKGSIEYVIIHELCHLVHRNHTKEFHRLQARMMPDWRKWKDRLEYMLA